MRILKVSHISSRGSSFRITLPRKIIKRLGLLGMTFSPFMKMETGFT